MTILLKICSSYKMCAVVVFRVVTASVTLWCWMMTTSSTGMMRIRHSWVMSALKVYSHMHMQVTLSHSQVVTRWLDGSWCHLAVWLVWAKVTLLDAFAITPHNKCFFFKFLLPWTKSKHLKNIQTILLLVWRALQIVLEYQNYNHLSTVFEVRMSETRILLDFCVNGWIGWTWSLACMLRLVRSKLC